MQRFFPTTFIRGLAGLAVLVIALLPAAAYFSVEYVSSAERLTHDARVQARVVSKVVTDNPDGWRDSAERFAAAIDEVRHAQSHTTVTDRSGEKLVAVGENDGPWRIYRQSPFHNFGIEAGAVVVSSSLQWLVMISALLAVAGLLGSLALLKLLREKVFAQIDFAESGLRQSNAELGIAATAFESQEGMFVTDASQMILRVNRAFTDITGYTAEEVVGQTPRLLSSGRHDAAFYAAMWESIQHAGAWHGEIWGRRKNGEIYPVWLTVTAVKADQEAAIHYVGTLTDITARRAVEDEIQSLAFYDPLTRLPNRRLLLERLQQALVASARSNNHGALLFIDLDKFKTLNDTLGHDMGDLMLQQVAQRLGACVREGDTVARMGGDEFVVLLENLSETSQEATTQTQTIGEKILTTMNQAYQLGEHEYHNTPSIGISLFCGQQEAADELLKRADLAMYQAKATGHNTLRFFDPKMQAVVTARVILQADLREGLRKNQFLLYYLAQVDGMGRLTGAKALLRWQHPQRGLVSPAEFIPLAEETGLILPLGHWVLETACAQLVDWATRPDTAHLSLAVKVSAHQFRHPDFVVQVLKVLDHTGANPQKLKLELTESLLLDGVEDVIAKMTALKARGVGFSLDDLGTGHSSLSHLKRLPLDQLKIDQSFVRDIFSATNEVGIVKAIVALAQSLGLTVIAEGVETQEQRDFLTRHGCSAFQGYLFGKPVPLGEFEARLKASAG